MTTKSWIFAGLLLTAACGDDDGAGTPDAAVPGTPDGATPDGDLPTADAGTADAAPYSAPTPIAVPLSPTGPDQLQAVAPGPNGTFYIVGFAAASPTDPKKVIVIKTTVTGPDPSFGGGDGIATTPLEFKGGTDELDIVVQPSGKIVVSATVANATNPLDTDVALVRLDATGAVDESFGTAGVRIIDFSTAIINGTTVTGGDRTRAIAVDSTGRIYVHGLQRGEGDFNGNPRTDTDFVVTRLGVDGAPDTEYGTAGKYVLDLRGGAPNMTPSSATPHAAYVFADGSIIASGYAVTEGLASGPQPVLFKLDPNGDPVTGFASNGVFHDLVLAVQTEVYGIAIHDNHLVTAGYGRDGGDQNDWVSLRFNLATGERDLTWGATANGAVLIDPSGTMVGDNCRNAIALPGGKTVLIGSTGPGNMPAQNAVFAVLDATGKLDPAYGDGVHVYPFGEGDGGNDQLWGGAVSGQNVLLVGWKGGGAPASQTTAVNDDSYAIVLPLR